MPLILSGNVASATADAGYTVANSCRLNPGAKLTKTFGSTSNRRTYTVSLWLKKCSTTTEQNFVFAGDVDGANPYFDARFDDTQIINWYHSESGGAEEFNLKTNAVFKDPSAWYHIVFAVDTTQGTDTNRLKLYVNGEQITSFSRSVYPDQDFDTAFNVNDYETIFGGLRSNTPTYDGYMAEVVMIDGSQLTPTSFGEFDEDSPTIWKPIDVSGLTFGTNGFYLDFEASDNLGNDANGGTDFTETDLAATDQATDTPTNNFPTINPLIKPASAITLSEGNLKAVFPGSWTALPATFGLTAGKWYFEAKNITSGQNAFIGVVTENQAWGDSTPYDETTGVVLYGPGGRKSVDGTDSDGFFATLSSGEIVGVHLDLDSDPKTILFSVDGTATPDTTPVDLPSTFDDLFIFPYFIGNSSSATANWEVNFGNPPYANSSDAADENGYGAFEYAPASGYYALCTKNLAEYG
jgi:hypothetical protein